MLASVLQWEVLLVLAAFVKVLYEPLELFSVNVL